MYASLLGAGFHLIDTNVHGYYQEYMYDFGRATFCLALTGAGWGARLKLAIMHGCIPVVVADRVHVRPSLLHPKSQGSASKVLVTYSITY